MKLRAIDLGLIAAYLLATAVVGWRSRKKARRNKEHYLLGGKSLPWYLLGLSDASDMFDLSGTMWLVTLCFVYGLKSVWIPWLWPVFNQIFLMAYLARWIRRSNATTGAEWLASRFGRDGPGVKASHIVVVGFALLSCMGFMAYGFVGLGKFTEGFVPWAEVQPYVPFSVPAAYVPHFYALVFTVFAVFYSILGGMRSIVFGDVIKYSLMTLACVSVGVVAIARLHGQELGLPDGWTTPFFGWKLELQWTGKLADANRKIAEDGFTLFGLFLTAVTCKGVLASLAGPTPNNDLQKILSTRSPREASKMSGLVTVVLMPIRYTLVMGLTVLALLHFEEIHGSLQGAVGTDFERLLPATINACLPAGILGLVLTAFLAAFMGTFSGTINAAQAYLINDVYLKYVNPAAGSRRVITMNYVWGVVFVAAGLLLGVFLRDVNTILQWMVSGLYGGYIVANVLKWHWWRFNAHGYFWGMVAGIAPAVVQAGLKSAGVIHGLDLYYWPLFAVLSLVGCIVGSYTAPATDAATLEAFYRAVRPWGFWGPVHAAVRAKDPAFVGNRNLQRNLLNIALGVTGQTALTLLPMYLVLGQKRPLLLSTVIIALVAWVLKKTWWDRLDDD